MKIQIENQKKYKEITIKFETAKEARIMRQELGNLDGVGLIFEAYMNIDDLLIKQGYPCIDKDAEAKEWCRQMRILK